MPRAKATKSAARKKAHPRVKTAARKKSGPKPKAASRRKRATAARTTTRRASRRPGRKPSGRVKRPFSVVLDAHELQVLKEIAKKKNSSVAGLIRGAMNAVIFQANPQLARAAVEKDVDKFLNGMKGKLPMSPRFDGRRKGLKKNLVEGIIAEMETG